MIGAAIAYNLKKWLNYKEQKRSPAVISLETMAEGLCFWLLVVQCLIDRHNNKPSYHFTFLLK